MTDVKAFDAAIAADAAPASHPFQGKVKNIVQMMGDYSKRVQSGDMRRLDLSKWLRGFKHSVRPLIPGDLMVIAADTGAGKTAALQAIAYHAAPPLPTIFFEIELSDDLMVERFLALHGKIEADQVEQQIKDKKFPDLMTGQFDNLYFCTLSNVTMEDIEAIIRYQNTQIPEPIAVVVIDYIGLIKGSGGSRYERFSNIAENLKTMAKSVDAIVVASSQIQRAQADATQPVGLHSCKDSGSIENSAGLLLGLWREGDTGREMKLRVLKNTRGVSGVTINAIYDGAKMQITDDYGIEPRMKTK